MYELTAFVVGLALALLAFACGFWWGRREGVRALRAAADSLRAATQAYAETTALCTAMRALNDLRDRQRALDPSGRGYHWHCDVCGRDYRPNEASEGDLCFRGATDHDGSNGCQGSLRAIEHEA